MIRSWYENKDIKMHCSYVLCKCLKLIEFLQTLLIAFLLRYSSYIVARMV